MARFPAVLPPRVWSPPRVAGSTPDLSPADVRVLAFRGLALGLLALLAIQIAVVAGHAAGALTSLGSLLPAAGGTVALTAAGIVVTLLAALPLALCLAAGRLTRSIGIAAAVPAVVPAVALVTIVGVAGPVAQAGLLVAVQAVVFAPIVAIRLKDAFAVSGGSWDAAEQLGATSWQRLWATIVPSVIAALPAAAAATALLSLADIASPVVVAPDVPTLGSAIWQHALAGDFGGAALAGVLLAVLAAPLLTIRWHAPGTATIAPQPHRMATLAGLALTGAAGLAFAVLLGATLASDAGWLAWPIALAVAGALAGSAIGSAAAVGIAESTHWPGWMTLPARILPLPVVGLAAVLTVGGAIGGAALVAIVAAGAGFTIALRLVTPPATLPVEIVEAVGGIGGSSADLLGPSAGRRIVAGALRTAGQTIGGAAAFVVLAGVDHPAAIALLPNAAAALAIGGFAVGCTLAAQAIDAEVSA